VDQFISTLISDHRLLDEPFFVDLQSGAMGKASFIKTQVSFFDAVNYFSIPMFILSSRLDTYEDRLRILENINDEHGNGDLSAAHGKTFLQYLKNLGVGGDTLSRLGQSVSCARFNQMLYNTCTRNHPFKGIAMLGIIEFRYAEISRFIATRVVRNGWLSEDKLAHYHLHESLDTHHAELFFKIIRPYWVTEKYRKRIKKGLRLGHDTFFQLYHDLLQDLDS
jgi:pyrroloquinoline-quinone synthase